MTKEEKAFLARSTDDIHARAEHQRRQELIRDTFLVVLVLVLVIGFIVCAATGHGWVAIFCLVGLWWTGQAVMELSKEEHSK